MPVGSPPPVAASRPTRPCFLLDGKDIEASERTVKALEELGASLLDDARAADEPKNKSSWAWCRIYLGDVFRDVMTFRFGANKDKPDALADVAVVGVR
jgi:hypothetical protein